ncbi:aryl hydrocarbon receptor nuclear translocator homolog [Anabrus simplex]|uniref:aryl hydrocarbon receptor nuclear translocator homolog n=1 Tax=Anabrus simplex TaxID=316456 RepID=UPI0035A2B891
MEDSREAVDADPEVEDDPDPPAATVAQHHQPSSSRQQRNKAEKQRRDKLNNFITELSTLVPMVASSPKRMDKTSILRLSATYLRMYRCLPLTSGDLCSLPSTQDSRSIYAHLLDILLDMDGFMLIVNATGKIVFVTHTVEKLLGHPQNDLLGQSLYNITCPDDHAELRKNLTPDEDPSAASASPVASDDSSSDDTTSSSAQSSPSPRLTSGTPEAPPGPTPPPERQRRSFYLHLSQRATSRSDNAQYETVHILGYLKVPHKPERGPPTHTRSRKQRELPTTNSNDIVLVAVAQLFKEKKITDLSLLEASRDEYVTRHTKDGRIIYSDHRISVVAGYMAEEVSGLSAFNFMHKEDVKLTLIALQRMYDLGEGHGSSCYRLMSKSGQFIYLRTHGYLEYDKDTQDVTTFICINTLMTEKEGEDGLKEMKKRFSASIASIGMSDFHNVITPGPSSVSAPEQPAISPVALEDSLPLSDMSQYMSGSEEQNHSPQPGPNAHYVNVVLYSHPSVHGQPNRVEPPKVQLSPLSPTCTATRLPVVTSTSSIVSSTTEVRPVERPTVLRESVITERVSAMPVPTIRSTMLERSEPNNRLEVEDVSSFRDSEPRWCKETTVLKRTISADLESAGTSKRLHTASKINRLRRRDSHTSPVEALRVEVPPTMSPDEQHRAILMRGGGPSSSPLYSGSNRSQTSPLQTHYGLLPGNGSISRNIIMHSPNSPPQSIAFFSSKVITRSPSPQSPSINTVHFSSTHISEYANQSSPHSPAHSALNFPHFNREQGTSVLSPASAFINCQNTIMSPEHVDSDTFSSLGLPEPDNNPDIHELLNLPLDTSVDGLKPEFISLDTLPDTFVEVTGSPDVAYHGLNVTAEVAPVLQDQVYSTMNRELRRHHLQLESRMQLQETQIISIEQDLDQVPQADQFRTNLTQLQAQHKKQQQLLNNLKQDHHKMHCAEKLNVCNVKQDVGV